MGYYMALKRRIFLELLELLFWKCCLDFEIIDSFSAHHRQSESPKGEVKKRAPLQIWKADMPFQVTWKESAWSSF